MIKFVLNRGERVFSFFLTLSVFFSLSIPVPEASLKRLTKLQGYNPSANQAGGKSLGGNSPTSSQQHLKPSNSASSLTTGCGLNQEQSPRQDIGDCIVGYHMCQADNNITCMVPEFVHSMASYMAEAPALAAYKELLLREPHLQSVLNIRQCIQDPSRSLIKGILEPLTELKQTSKITANLCVILIDSLNEAEFHKPDYGDTVGSFLSHHIDKFPQWLKVVMTARSAVVADVTTMFPFRLINLDELVTREEVQEDIYGYIIHRINSSPDIQNNLSLTPQKAHDLQFQDKFVRHVHDLTKGCFLYCKLLLELIQRGSLVLKSTNFKILPVNLTEIFLLSFNLKFPTIRSFERVVPILNVALATLYPLVGREIYEAVNSAFIKTYVSYGEFEQRLNTLKEFLVLRGDGTYMLFHPAFREWLLRREEGQSNKFICDLRSVSVLNILLIPHL